ncbi:hypothetical protein C8R42DRAFT_668690 [Lentinula raphanica]|nr:hypothetical protein C8R42DRAFT_668690 [Lentinula raphanica]
MTTIDNNPSLPRYHPLHRSSSPTEAPCCIISLCCLHNCPPKCTCVVHPFKLYTMHVLLP